MNFVLNDIQRALDSVCDQAGIRSDCTRSYWRIYLSDGCIEVEASWDGEYLRFSVASTYLLLQMLRAILGYSHCKLFLSALRGPTQEGE
ncbi:MAG TPA: hypothetical protein VJ808_05085 [Gemmatimonadales bacterium]|nr:hypothetical protein [Gemmatimonadales bacterium]